MKWKKFFYRQLCLREEILICKSPTCADCCDQAKCFGPEVPEEGSSAMS
jgi:nitrogen fixation protein NifQ